MAAIIRAFLKITRLLRHLVGDMGKTDNGRLLRFGKVYSDPHLSGGGLGHLQLTHPLGVLFFITDLRVKRVHALMHNHSLAVDLVGAITAEFEGGALGTIGGTGNLGGSNGRCVHAVAACTACSTRAICPMFDPRFAIVQRSRLGQQVARLVHVHSTPLTQKCR